MENKKSTKAKTEKENAQAAQAVDQQQFLAKLNDLLEMAKKKKNMLEYQEISEYFKDMNGKYKCVMNYRQRLDYMAKFFPKENIVVKTVSLQNLKYATAFLMICVALVI